MEAYVRLKLKEKGIRKKERKKERKKLSYCSKLMSDQKCRNCFRGETNTSSICLTKIVFLPPVSCILSKFIPK